MAASEQDELAEVLAAHQVSHHGTTIEGFRPCTCGCGWTHDCVYFGGWAVCDMYHRAHVADAILASDWLAQRDRRVAGEAVEKITREWQFGGWTALSAPTPPGAIPALAQGQIVTDWLRERANRIEGE